MSKPDDTAGSAKAALRAALFDYSHAPGKYQVAMRQPPQLFAALRDVLQLAVSREGDAPAGGGDVDAASLRDAARFFIRTALLYPGADHYALLGVDRKADNTDLKDRYRLMMRLLHPDFAGPAAGAWPPDSAVRVNRAYDTLSSAVQRRIYDEGLTPLHGASPAQAGENRRPQIVPLRVEEDTRQSRFKTLAAVCAVAGVALVVVSLFGTGTSETGHLVQRARVQLRPEPVRLAAQEQDPAPATLVERLNDSLTQMLQKPADQPPDRKQIATTRVVPSARSAENPRPPQVQAHLQPGPSSSQSPAAPEPRWDRISAGAPPVAAAPSQPEARAEVLAITAPATVVAPAPSAQLLATAAPMQAAPPGPKPATKPGPTLAEAQPLLSQLLQVMESGRGDRILNLLDAEARNKPSAQALSRQYDTLVDGARPVRVSHVELKAEPADGRLLVVGSFRVLAGEQTIGSLGKKMVLRAEFASREGNVVITGLSGGLVN